MRALAPALNADAPGPASIADQALLRACASILAPLARLAVAHGMPYARFDDVLRKAFVDAARGAHPDVPAHGTVSRVSATTGLNRREVTRLINADAEPEPPRRSPATELFTRWLSHPKLRRKGVPLRSLPRQGAAPSFESLAQSVTKDVHPRTLLEELCRLGLAEVDEASDRVILLQDKFVPADDARRMFNFLGSNVGDHLSAAVDNVSDAGPRHLEQALFADELSSDSLQRLRPIVSEQWQALLRELAPTVQQLIDKDQAAGRVQDQRLRVGMYAYTTRMGESSGEVPRAHPATAKTAASRRSKA